CARRGTFAYW
nr:immunoglobulin heavy chain junction region [Mus musculus]